MDISVYRPGELTSADRAAWTAMQSKAHLLGSPEPANPFLSPEFTLAVGRAFQRTAAGAGRAVGFGVSDAQGVVQRERSPKFTRTTLAKERGLRRDHEDVRYVHDERDPAALGERVSRPGPQGLQGLPEDTRPDGVGGVGALRNRVAKRKWHSTTKQPT